jgi:hypothetical protein
MAAYRSAAPPPVRTLDVRPEPLLTTIVVALMGPLFLVPGLVFLAGFVMAVPTDRGAGTWMFALMGLAFTGAGALVGVYGVRGLTTVVRFSEAPTEIVLEWRRRGKVVKTERIAREDLVDIAVSDTPASGGGLLYGLAVGTRLGDIALSSGFTQQRAFYAQKRDELCSFLNARPRP